MTCLLSFLANWWPWFQIWYYFCLHLYPYPISSEGKKLKISKHGMCGVVLSNLWRWFHIWCYFCRQPYPYPIPSYAEKLNTSKYGMFAFVSDVIFAHTLILTHILWNLLNMTYGCRFKQIDDTDFNSSPYRMKGIGIMLF